MIKHGAIIWAFLYIACRCNLRDCRRAPGRPVGVVLGVEPEPPAEVAVAVVVVGEDGHDPEAVLDLVRQAHDLEAARARVDHLLQRPPVGSGDMIT